MNNPLSNCCGRPPLGEVHNNFAHCSDCKEMAEFYDADEESQQIDPIREWAERAAQELANLTTLVDWQSDSKRLSEQIDGSDAIGYEWSYWHKKQDEGRAAGERIVTLFDEFKKLSAQ